MTLLRGLLTGFFGPLRTPARSRARLALGVFALWAPGALFLIDHPWAAQGGWLVWCVACGVWLVRTVPMLPPAEPLPAPADDTAELLHELPMPACICSLPGGGMRVLNAALASMANESADALQGRSIVEFCQTAEDRSRVVEVLAQGRGTDDVELPLRRRDGSVRWVSAATRPVSHQGQPALLVICHDITGHKQAERSLAASEERFRVLLGALSEAVVLYDAQARVLTSNRSAESCAWLDAAHAGLPGGGDEFTLCDEQGRSLARDMHPVIRSLADGLPARDVVIGAESASGQMRWLTVNTQPLFHAGSKRPYAVVASYSDLTARIRAERALRASEQRYALALRGMNEGLAEWITGSDRMYVSPRLSQIMGYDAGGRRMRVREFVAGIHPHDRKAWSAMVASHLKGRSDHFQQELRMRHADGGYRWFLLRGVAQRDASGRSSRVVGTVADITLRKRLEEVDVAERELLSLIAAAMPLSEVMSRFARLVSGLLNEDSICAVLTLTPGTAAVVDVVGANLPPALADWLRRGPAGADHDGRLLETLAGRRPLLCEDVQASPDLEGCRALFAAEGVRALWALPLAAQDGAVLGGLIILHPQAWRPGRADENVIERLVDIAQLALERARAERQVRELNESLERRVAERTTLLEQANSELEAFSYSVSHDLRSPLRAINGFAHLLAEHAGAVLDDEGRDMLERIQRGASRMGLLIDDILHFSRVSRVDMAHSEINLDTLAANVVADLAEQYPAASVELSPLGHASGDQSMLRQVFVNLIGNALKFSSRSPQPRVEVFVENRRGIAAICVRDNGVGFDPAYADRLFGVFQRMHGAEEFPGTGVGLAIVKRIVERHGGVIGVEAAPGRGATFRFTLAGFRPFDQADAVPAGEKAKPGAVSRTGT